MSTIDRNTIDVITAILTRRSIRKFTPGHIDDEYLHVILRAGFHAPTAGNKRPVHFIVIRDRELLKAFSIAKREAAMIAEADLAIVVCGDQDRQAYHDFLHEDCAASIENMLLCIHGLDLGAVWCGIPSILTDCYKLYQARLGLPTNIIPVAIIAVGVPNEEKTHIDRFDEKRVHYEHW